MAQLHGSDGFLLGISDRFTSFLSDELRYLQRVSLDERGQCLKNDCFLVSRPLPVYLEPFLGIFQLLLDVR